MVDHGSAYSQKKIGANTAKAIAQTRIHVVDARINATRERTTMRKPLRAHTWRPISTEGIVTKCKQICYDTCGELSNMRRNNVKGQAAAMRYYVCSATNAQAWFRNIPLPCVWQRMWAHRCVCKWILSSVPCSTFPKLICTCA